eukprot:9921329-Alexandrium_andersonii.AAC.1
MAVVAGSITRELHGQSTQFQEGVASLLPMRWAVPILRRARAQRGAGPAPGAHFRCRASGSPG